MIIKVAFFLQILCVAAALINVGVLLREARISKSDEINDSWIAVLILSFILAFVAYALTTVWPQ